MRKIAIVGTAPGSRELTPVNDASWDIWVCSPGNRGSLPRITAWFELHGLADILGPENRSWAGEYLPWLKAQTFPVYMQEKNEHVPGAIVFPYKDLIEHFKTRNWFTSSPAWMMAYAIMQKPDEIGIFGVDMAAAQEYYTMQKGGLLYWIEKAQERGIKVTVPLESCLGAPTPLYGYGEASRMGRRLVVAQFVASQNRQRMMQERDQLTLSIAFHDGALEQIAYMQRTWVDGAADAEIDVAPDLDDKAKAYAATAWHQLSVNQKPPEPDPAKMPATVSAGGVYVPTVYPSDGIGAAMGAFAGGGHGDAAPAKKTHGQAAKREEGPSP